MTDKQIFFCAAYASGMNATEAAIAAGYAERGAKRKGEELLKRKDVMARIEVLNSDTSGYVLDDNQCADQSKVIRELQKIALMPLDDIHITSGLVKVADKTRALDLLGKQLALVDERKCVEAANPFAELTSDELRRLLDDK